MDKQSDLSQFLEASWTLDENIRQLFKDAKAPTGHRQIITLGMCLTSHGHCTGQRIMIESDIVASAMAMVRIHFESVVRSLWYAAGASDEWISKLAQPVFSADQGEPVLGPPIDSMLDRLDQVAPPHIGGALRELKNATWKPMNSFVHGGVHAVVQGLRENPPEELIAVLKNANGLSLMNAQALVIGLADPRLSGRIRLLQTSHQRCLPT